MLYHAELRQPQNRSTVAFLRRLVAVLSALFGLLAAALAVAPAAVAATTVNHPLVAQHELDMLNAERRAHGLPALKMNAQLITSASRHSADMAAHNSMSHQLAGEKSLGSRVSGAGYNWGMAAENVGWTTLMTATGARALESMMYVEKAPEDGHRLNILSSSYKDIGISIITDTTHHRLWITEDFGRKM